MNDKQATPGREPGFYWVKFYGEWEVMKLDSKWGWQHEGEDILEETLEEIGERIERQTPDGGIDTDYVPFGPEWEAEMMKWNKTELIDFARRILQERQPTDGWVDVRERLPEDFNADGRTPYYLVWVDNPFFKDNHLHTACLMKSPYGSRWSSIEPNVHRFLDDAILITHWMPPPPPPQRVETNKPDK